MEQTAWQQSGQMEGIRVALLGVGGGLICGVPGKKVAPHELGRTHEKEWC